MKLNGLDRIEAYLRDKMYDSMREHDCMPISLDDCQHAQDCIDSFTIGQLFTIANLGDRMKNFKLLSVDKEGTVYLEFCGMFGGMDLDGFIHT